MKHVKTFQLFEAATRQSVTDEIVNALENTVEGKDLLALATRPPEKLLSGSPDPYKARKTGRVEINNLRGRTYITQLDDGKWYHAVEATGRKYGEGIYDSLTDCIRGMWTDFIVNSTSIRPKGMPLKMYAGFVNKEINNLIGKNLNTLETRRFLSKAYFGGKEPMTEKSPIFSSPRWKQIFNFLGFGKKTNPPAWDGGGRMSIFYIDDDKKSFKSSLNLAAEMILPNDNSFHRSLYSSHFSSALIEIIFNEYPEKMIFGHSHISIGDTIEKCKEVETIAAKRFIKMYSEVDDSYLSRLNDPILKMFVDFAIGIFAKGMEGEDEIEMDDTIFFQSIAHRMKDLPAEGLSRIRRNLPELWEIYKKSVGGEATIDGIETLADLGDLGF
jgi:hypothetical protein